MAIPWAGIGSVLGGLGGLFGGGSRKGIDPGHAMRKQAWGAVQASKEYGFNPLTMLQYGQPGAGIAASGAPLASIDLITGGLRDISDEVTGRKAQQERRDELENDLLQIQIDQLRSGVVARPASASPPSAVERVSASPSPLGRRPLAMPNGGAVHAEPRPSLAARPPQHPRTRNNEPMPVTWSDGKPVYIPRGVGERLDLGNFDNVTAGDIEELRGELVGGAENTIRAADVVRYQTTGAPLGQVPSRPAISVDGGSTADLYEKVFGPDHPATKKSKKKDKD